MESEPTHPQEPLSQSPIQNGNVPIVIATTTENEMSVTVTTPTNTITAPITTISTSTLVEILNSVAAGVTIQSTQATNDGDLISQNNPSLQLQVQLNPQVLDVVGLTEEVEDSGGQEGRGRKPGSGGRGGKGKEKQPWHYHLGGVRHCRVPLSPDIKEALEVAYVSRIMSKNFRKEGQPEKERIARITGLEIDKVQEWFKNRRKKDKLLQSRVNCPGTPKGKRGRKLMLPHIVKTPPTTPSLTLSTSPTHVQEQVVEP